MEADSADWDICRQAEGLSKATEKPRAGFTLGLDQSKGLSALEEVDTHAGSRVQASGISNCNRS